MHPSDSAPAFTVTPPHAASVLSTRRLEAVRRAPCTAVLVAHGMGQQLQFQTLNDVAEGLRSAVARAGQPAPPVHARAIGVGDDRLQRLEMTIGDRAVHVYEAYWAPLTEGQVTLRDVIAFLFRAGVDGLRHSFRWFKRYLAQQYVEFAIPIRTPLYLMTALLVVLSLVVMNTAIVGLPALRTPMRTPPAWAGALLFRDITVVLDLFVDAVLLFAVTLAISYLARAAHWPGWATGWLTVPAFVVLITITIAAGASVPLIVYYYAKGGGIALPTVSILDDAFGRDRVQAIFDGTAALLLALAAIAVVVGLAFVGLRILRSLVIDPWMKPVTDRQKWLTLPVLAAFVAVLYAVWRIAWPILLDAGAGYSSADRSLWRVSLAWPLTMAASALARSFLVQFVGDVAAYIEPQELDRFSTLRQRIKDCVWGVARAVYLADEGYDRILVVGHSLGSVIVYDTLNRLIREESLGTVPEVVDRTKLLLTFGSPLDKIAFLFAIQGKNQEGREALAASVQPLLWDPDRRPAWINIYSPWDIISGSLDFFDRPHHPVKPVVNRSDPAASVWLGAHTQYWSGPLLFDTLLGYVTAPSIPDASGSR